MYFLFPQVPLVEQCIQEMGWDGNATALSYASVAVSRLMFVRLGGQEVTVEGGWLRLGNGHLSPSFLHCLASPSLLASWWLFLTLTPVNLGRFLCLQRILLAPAHLGWSKGTLHRIKSFNIILSVILAIFLDTVLRTV